MLIPIQSYRRRNPCFPQGGRSMPRCRIRSANIRSALCIPCTTAPLHHRAPIPPALKRLNQSAPKRKTVPTKCGAAGDQSRFVCLVLSICFILLIRRYPTRGLGSKHVLSSRKPSFASITDTLTSTKHYLNCSETTL